MNRPSAGRRQVIILNSTKGRYGTMSETILKIEGMNCGHCKMSVEKALKGVPGVVTAQVDLAAKQAVVTGTADRAVMAQAVQAAGFKVAG